MYSPSQKLSDILTSVLGRYFQNVDNEHVQVRSGSGARYASNITCIEYEHSTP
jgi:hypothetical protein